MPPFRMVDPEETRRLQWSRLHREAPVAVAVVAKVTDSASRASLDRAILSVVPHSDACVVVLDDRSLPEVDDELRALGASVVRRAWTDDFAAARNAVHEHTDATWLLVIDADEVLLDPGNLAAMITRAEREGHDGVLCRVDTVGDDGPGATMPQIRVYRRERCRWRYAVHNELVGPRSVVPSTAVFLASYVGTLAEKAARSIPLLLREVERDPDEPRWAHFLAQTYHATGETEAMVRWAERCLALAPDEEVFVHRRCDLALARFAEPGREAEGLATAVEAVRRHPSHPDPWHVLATIALAEWYRTGGRGRTLTPVRTARHVTKLPEVASALGLPLRYGDPAPAASPAPSRPRVTRSGGKLRIAFIEQLGIGDGRFLDGLVAALGERAEVHHVETLSLAEAAEAATWADVVWLEWARELTVQATRRLPVLRDKPVVCRIHGHEVFGEDASRVDWSVVDRLVFVASHKRDLFLERHPELAGRAVVLRNGVDAGRFTVAPDKRDTRHAVAIGPLVYRKGHCLLLQFFHELVRRDERFRLTIRGAPDDPRYAMALRTMIDELGLAGRVTLATERIDDLNGWLADKSHVVSFSLEESFHLALGEAMAAGLRPVIHAWREARYIWPEEHVFADLDGFLARMLDERFEPERYRGALFARGLDQATHVARTVDLIEELLGRLLETARSP